jgi:hypothetical protein
MASFPATRFLPHLIVLSAVCATAVFLARPRELRGNPDGPIPLELPEQLGPYTADNLWFCHNDQCARAFLESALPAAAPEGRLCPSCTNALHAISLGEAKMLPRGTPIFRKVYTARARPEIQVTLVFTGSERVSIHRPQICLVSQGNRMINEYEYEALVQEGRRMPVRVIETVRDTKTPDGLKRSDTSVFVYWFFNPERETTSHFERLFWMAYDNAARGYRARWAYVSLVIAVDPAHPEAFRAVLDEFVPRIYPITERLRAAFREMDGVAPRTGSASNASP